MYRRPGCGPAQGPGTTESGATMSEPRRDGDGPPRKRVPRVGEVVRTSRVTPHMIRVVLGGPGLAGFPDGEFTDRYVKLLFPPAGACHGGPHRRGEVPAARPQGHPPGTRTYTDRKSVVEGKGVDLGGRRVLKK